MAVFRVYAERSVYSYADIEAENADEAMKIAGGLPDGEFDRNNHTSCAPWEISYAEPLTEGEADE